MTTRPSLCNHPPNVKMASCMSALGSGCPNASFYKTRKVPNLSTSVRSRERIRSARVAISRACFPQPAAASAHSLATCLGGRHSPMLGASALRFGETKAVRRNAAARTTRLGRRYRETRSRALPAGQAGVQGAGTDPPSAGAVHRRARLVCYSMHARL